jgi:hypothetical protein
MRPKQEEEETIVCLNRYNFEEWKFHLDQFLIRKAINDSKRMFAYMIKTLKAPEIRLVMPCQKRENPYEAAIELLTEKDLKKGLQDKIDKTEMLETQKEILKRLRLRSANLT